MKMRAIIIAAGRAKRMQDLSEGLPKCLLEVNGETILRRQIGTFRSCGISDIVVIKGYKKELINYPDVRYRVNDAYMENNILNSLFYAEEDMEGDLIISYGDILFDAQIISALLRQEEDFVIVADRHWNDRYRNRHAHPVAEAEKVVMDNQGRLVEIGKILRHPERANAEFIGMVKVSAEGAAILKDVFRWAKETLAGKPFQEAKTFQQSYLTDMLQELVDRRYEINCLPIEGGWLEIDTPEDYTAAKRIFI